ncbi:MAG: transposase, partial [Candidatus Sulfotelmatobacter sp.]
MASYIGMIPCEHTRGKRQRLGKLTKEGNSLLRYLWTEATMHAVRKDLEIKRFYRRKLIQKGMGKARIAAAGKLGIRLWIMLRDQIDYQEFCRRGKLRQKGEAHADSECYGTQCSQSLQFGECCAKKKVGRESSERQLSTPAQTARAGVRRLP